MKRFIFANPATGSPAPVGGGASSGPVPPTPTGGGGGGNDDDLDSLLDRVKEERETEKKKKTDWELAGKIPGGSAIEYFTDWNELANLIKFSFGVSDPNYTTPEGLRKLVSQNSPLFEDKDNVRKFVGAIKNFLTKGAWFSKREPQLPQKILKFAFNYLDKVSSVESTISKINSLAEKADIDNPSDAYIIELLNGNEEGAALLLILSSFAKNKRIDNKALGEAATLIDQANKLYGPKSLELLEAQKVRNSIADKNFEQLENSFARFKVLVPAAVQANEWNAQANSLFKNFYGSEVAKFLLQNELTKAIFAWNYGIQGQVRKMNEVPISELSGGDVTSTIPKKFLAR